MCGHILLNENDPILLNENDHILLNENDHILLNENDHRPSIQEEHGPLDNIYFSIILVQFPQYSLKPSVRCLSYMYCSYKNLVEGFAQ